MADTAIAITAGTGTNVDTRTEGTNGNHRQVIVIGDPATNAGVAPVDATAGVKVNLGADNDVVVTNAGTFAVQVDAAIPAGTNNIGDVDVLSVVPGTGATNLGKAEDAIHASGDTGVMALFVRQDTQSDFAADGDYVPGSIDADGALRVSAGTQHTTSQTINAGARLVTLPTDVALPAGETHLGEVGGATVVKTITMTADTGIMASADIIADTQQLDAAFRKANGTGVLQSLTVFDPDDNTAFAFDVYVHNTSTSMGTENNGITITDANAAAGILGVVSFAATDVKDLINGKMYHKANIGLPVSAVSGTDDLYFSLVNGSGTPTFGGGSIPMRVGILQD